jgi:transposase
VQSSGKRWEDLPPCFGPWQTVYGQFRKWRLSGVWSLITQELKLTAPIPQTSL